MYRTTSILTALFFVSGLGAGETSFASEATSSVATETKVSSPIETSQGSDLRRQLAIALAAGGEALSQFRGPAMKTEAEKTSLAPRCRAWIAVLTASLTMSPATDWRSGTRKKPTVALYGSSTNCKLCCRRIVGEGWRPNQGSMRSEVIPTRTRILTPTSMST